MIDFIINTIIYFVACIPTFIGGKLFHTYFAEKEKRSGWLLSWAFIFVFIGFYAFGEWAMRW